MTQNRFNPYYISPYKGGYHLIEKSGRNVSVSEPEDVWSVGGLYTGFLQAAVAVRLKAGGHASDTAAGVGAQSVLIEGLDANFDVVMETVATNGISVSLPTEQTFIRVYKATIQNVGAYGASNVGNIDIETTGGVLLAQLDATHGQTEMCIYTIPDKFIGFIKRLTISAADSGDGVDVFLKTRANADDVATPFQGVLTRISIPDATDQFEHDDVEGIILQPRTDVWVQVDKAGTGTNPSVGITLTIVLVPESAW